MPFVALAAANEEEWPYDDPWHDRPMATPPMPEINRPELDAKLELIETKMDARIGRIESKIENLIEVVKDSKDESSEARRSFKSWGMSVIITVVLATVASLIGVWQIVTGVNQSIIAAFESGRNVGQQQPPPTPPKPPR